jgi:hypothetical protein
MALIFGDLLIALRCYYHGSGDSQAVEDYLVAMIGDTHNNNGEDQEPFIRTNT